jgi:uncharacterized protein
MAEKGHQGFASMDEERRRQIANEGGHTSHEKGASHEYNNAEAADGGRRGEHARQMASANRESAGMNESGGGQTAGSGGTITNGAQGETGGGSAGESTSQRSRKTRGGTHDQHVTAGKKGGSRIRQLIELGYKYEQEHGIGPGQNDRSKLAAKRRVPKPADGGGEENADE